MIRPKQFLVIDKLRLWKVCQNSLVFWCFAKYHLDQDLYFWNWLMDLVCKINFKFSMLFHTLFDFLSLTMWVSHFWFLYMSHIINWFEFNDNWPNICWLAAAILVLNEFLSNKFTKGKLDCRFFFANTTKLRSSTMYKVLHFIFW